MDNKWMIMSAVLIVLLLVTAGLAFYFYLKLNVKKKEYAVLEKAFQDMENSNQNYMEVFRSSLSHGMRMPISIIQGYAELLKNDTIEDENQKKEIIEKIFKNTNVLSQMVKYSLLQIEAKQMEPVCILDKVNINEVLKVIVNMSKTMLLKKGILLQLNLPEREYMIMADRVQIINIVNILFENSLKYMEKKGYINITLVESGDDRIMLVYKDNGVGMDEKESEKIFEKKYQGSNGKQGEGMGMNIVKRIVDEHNANIEVKTGKNKGMGIYIEFYIV